MKRAYLFEAKGIQRWVLEGDKLRDIAAASALLDWTARSGGRDDLLGEVLARTEFAPRISRRAGGAFMLHFDDDGETAFARFRVLWRLAFMRLLPGLEFQEALAASADDRAAGTLAYAPASRLSFGREGGAASLLPLSHPLATLCQRTGAPATATYSGGEAIDQATLAKRRARRLSDGVAERLGEGLDGAVWPNQMEIDSENSDGGALFPFRSPEDRIAVVHADISGLGAFYVGVRQETAKLPQEQALTMAKKASDNIEAAVLAAGQQATREVLWGEKSKNGVIPARPILVGGDDITLIVRGDLAMRFTRCFLEALEAETERVVKRRLTAAAGIAFGGPKQPFFRLLRLAEGLCGFAKTRAKGAAGAGATPPSVLAFHRVTESALSTGAAEMLSRPPGSCQPYRLGAIPATGLAEFTGLIEVLRAMEQDEIKPGGLRAIRGMAAEDRSEDAREAWAAWRRAAASRPGGPAALKALDAGVAATLGQGIAAGSSNDLSAVFAGQEFTGGSPLFDALEWRAVA